MAYFLISITLFAFRSGPDHQELNRGIRLVFQVQNFDLEWSQGHSIGLSNEFNPINNKTIAKQDNNPSKQK